MRRILLGIILLVLFLLPTAEAAEDTPYERAQLEYLCCLVSTSSYDDDLNLLVREKLQELGWDVYRFAESNAVADAKGYLVHRPLPDTGEDVYILAITGTESMKDAEVDMRLRQVPFGGATIQGFLKIENRQPDSSLPLVHQGFNDYTRTAFFTSSVSETDQRTLGELLREELLSRENARLYITGHSLGGAVAVLLAARLSDMGVPPEMLDVITFGAPAVGNEAFARQYENRMNLERVVIKGDPVKSVLQSISSNYVQFGQKVEWRKNRYLQRFPHEVAVYLDESYRNYYNVRDLQPENHRAPRFFQGIPKITAKVYVAPICFSLDAHLKEDEKYMRYAVEDILRRRMAEPVFAGADEGQADVAELCRRAREAGCQYVLMDSFEGSRVKEEGYNFRLTLEETLYDAQGNALDYQSASVTTKKMTPIEGILYVHEAVNAQRESVLNR